MDAKTLEMARQIAEVVTGFQRQCTGHAPSSVTVLLSGDTLVITLHDALSPAEKVLAARPEGATQIQEYHRQLFANSSAVLREAIARITGRVVREGAVEVEPNIGAVVHAFTTGTMVQVYLLNSIVPTPAATAGEPHLVL